MSARIVLLLLLLTFGTLPQCQAQDFDDFVRPILSKKCVHCHGGDEPSGNINLQAITQSSQFLKQPALIKELIDVIDANDMPPEGEPQLSESERVTFLKTLKTLLRQATAGDSTSRLPLRRLNRFQYNNAVRDLFQLNRNVFSLPEKLMTRHSNYLLARDGRMPDQVSVESHSLKPESGLKDVNAFPKDLRASHGFDNQANQLTLSPLLLDAFLRLSVSIVESPDFNEQTVGIWQEFFTEPEDDVELSVEVSDRLKPFLLLAFRKPVDDVTRDRYVSYVVRKIETGVSFTEAMKKVTSAVLSSPLFLYRSENVAGENAQFGIASRLSFFLWGSGPDQELLALAERGELSNPQALQRTINRMLADPKIERFLDTFPSQWMQLENVLAATPDPKKQRFFTIDRQRPASLQMVLEPLLLFDAAFIEDRPVVELLTPEFSYRSEFLRTWYTSDLQAPKVDRESIVTRNRLNDEQRKKQQEIMTSAKTRLDALIGPVKERLLKARQQASGETPPVDLKPYAAWEFDDLKSSVGEFDLTAHGKVEFADGMAILKRAYLQSPNLPIDIQAKSLEVWCKVHDVNQRGGGVMTVQGPGDFFDAIVLGERKPKHWISGSNGFSRTDDFPESTPEEEPDQMLHLVMVYSKDGTTTLYRNGKPYGKPFRKGMATFPKGRTSILFGLRHVPAGGNKYLSVSIDKARLYNRQLTAAEVSSSFSGYNQFITNEELLAALSKKQRAQKISLETALDEATAALKKIPQNRDPGKLQQDSQRRFDDRIRSMVRAREFERVPADDPRYGGVITNAAMMSMTSGPKRTHPIARGAWIIEVILNDPPPPPPNDVPPLDEDAGDANLTIREKFAVHRENPDCAGCHSRLDPLGFALENFDITGRWRDRYENGRDVDSSGTLMRKYEYADVVDFKNSLVTEERRFAKAFTGHLLRFALSRELTPGDSLTVDEIADRTEPEKFRLRSLIRHVIHSDAFLGAGSPDRQ